MMKNEGQAFLVFVTVLFALQQLWGCVVAARIRVCAAAGGFLVLIDCRPVERNTMALWLC
jgi:hypothetical protein